MIGKGQHHAWDLLISFKPNPIYAILCLVKLVKLTSLWKTNWYNKNWILQYSFFIRRAKVSCRRTGSRDSWKMVRAILCTPQKICKWQLLCSCETFVRALLCTPQKICKWQLLCSCETFVRALLCTPQKICKWQLLCSCETFQLKSNRFQFMTMIHFVDVELDKNG